MIRRALSSTIFAVALALSGAALAQSPPLTTRVSQGLFTSGCPIGATLGGGGAGAPTNCITPPAQNRLFLDNGDQTPQGAILTFNNANAVADFFGASSNQATLAGEFFSGYGGPGAQAMFTRYPACGARPRLFGGNIVGVTLAQLQTVAGTLSIPETTGTLTGSVDLSTASSFSNAASLIQTAINASPPTVGVYPGSSIAPATASITAYATGCFLVVTNVASGTLAPGDEVATLAAFDATGVFISAQISGTTGGTGVYGLSVGVGFVASESMSVTYGVLTVGTVSSGNPAEGQLLTGSGVAAQTTIARNLTGSGAGSTWIVPQTQTVTATTISASPMTMNVTYNQVTGATVNSANFWFVGNSYFPTDSSQTISYAGGTAAQSLGLTQAAGAVVSSPGSTSPNIAAFMSNIVTNIGDDFGTVQTTFDLDYFASSGETTQASAFTAWANSTGGQFTFLQASNTSAPAVAPVISNWSFAGNIWTVAPPSGIAEIDINDVVGGQISRLCLLDAGTKDWCIIKAAGGHLQIIDSLNSAAVALDIATGGNVAIGEPGSTVTAPNLQRALGQSHIPFVIPSSGTMGSNGALSAITAVATTYPAAYVYLPAGAISSGSLAGWYFAIFSSTTAATVYNNVYTSGTPTIPGAPTPFVTTGPGSYTQTTGSFLQSYALTIAGNTLGINGSIRVTGIDTYNNSAGAKSLQASYGGTAFATFGPTTTVAYGFAGGFGNSGVTNVQVGIQPIGMSTGAVATLPDRAAIDSTANQTFALALKLATATDTVTLENALVELIPGVP